jgi:hypothetical protein
VELTLKAEQDEYAREGIQWEPVKHFDNAPICKLISGLGGVFDLLNEECVFPEGTDQSFFAKISSILGRNEHFALTQSRTNNHSSAAARAQSPRDASPSRDRDRTAGGVGNFVGAPLTFVVTPFSQAACVYVCVGYPR